MPHSVIYTLEAESWKWYSIGSVASGAPAKQVWYAKTYLFDTQLSPLCFVRIAIFVTDT